MLGEGLQSFTIGTVPTGCNTLGSVVDNELVWVRSSLDRKFHDGANYSQPECPCSQPHFPSPARMKQNTNLWWGTRADLERLVAVALRRYLTCTYGPKRLEFSSQDHADLTTRRTDRCGTFEGIRGVGGNCARVISSYI